MEGVEAPRAPRWLLDSFVTTNLLHPRPNKL